MRVEDRVNLFLDGVDSFGARDTLPQVICNDPPQAADGQAQQPRVDPEPRRRAACAARRASAPA